MRSLVITHRQMRTADRDFNRLAQWGTADNLDLGPGSQAQFTQSGQPFPARRQTVNGGCATDGQLSEGKGGVHGGVQLRRYRKEIVAGHCIFAREAAKLVKKSWGNASLKTADVG